MLMITIPILLMELMCVIVLLNALVSQMSIELNISEELMRPMVNVLMQG
jgi:hypothetical protein